MERLLAEHEALKRGRIASTFEHGRASQELALLRQEQVWRITRAFPVLDSYLCLAVPLLCRRKIVPRGGWKPTHTPL